MASREMDPAKFLTWAVIAWLLCVASVAGAGWVIYQYGVVVVEMSPGFEKIHYNVPVIAGAISQAAAALLLAGMFTMLNGIYAGVAETHNSLQR